MGVPLLIVEPRRMARPEKDAEEGFHGVHPRPTLVQQRSRPKAPTMSRVRHSQSSGVERGGSADDLAVWLMTDRRQSVQARRKPVTTQGR